jgi:hypothetical protein
MFYAKFPDFQYSYDTDRHSYDTDRLCLENYTYQVVPLILDNLDDSVENKDEILKTLNDLRLGGDSVPFLQAIKPVLIDILKHKAAGHIARHNMIADDRSYANLSSSILSSVNFI